jgi:hypothetical protein
MRTSPTRRGSTIGHFGAGGTARFAVKVRFTPAGVERIARLSPFELARKGR